MINIFVVGITGRSGSGKSILSAYYREKSYSVMDGDAVARALSYPNSPYTKELVKAFGNLIVDKDGNLIRDKLAQIAFSNKENTELLSKTTHPLILKEFLRRKNEAETKGEKLFFIDGAAIIKGIFQPYCKKIILVTTNPKLAVSRLILRDGVSKTAVSARLAAQMSDDELAEHSDYIIENSSTVENLFSRADAVLQDILAQIDN